MPAPRRTPSIIGPLFRTVFAWPYRIALRALYRAGFRGWQLTALSLVANGAIGWLLVTGRRFLPGMLLMVAGLLDIFDGGVARLRGEESRAGAFLDSVVDRASDLVVMGCLFWSEAGQGRRPTAALALASLITTLLTSHLRAEAEAVEVELTGGFVQRLERFVLLMIGLTAPGGLLPVLVVMTALSGLTVLQRMGSAWVHLSGRPKPRRRK